MAEKPDTSYPANWDTPGTTGKQRPAEPTMAPVEAVALAIDSFIAALDDDEFNALVARTRTESGN